MSLFFVVVVVIMLKVLPISLRYKTPNKPNKQNHLENYISQSTPVSLKDTVLNFCMALLGKYSNS